MNKEDIYRLLKEENVPYELDEHKAVYNMEELKEVTLKYPDRDGKNLFVRDDRKRNYYLITVMSDKRVDLKEFRNIHKTRPLSFASSEDLMKYLELSPGSVTPFGLLNEKDASIIFYLDEEFEKGNGLIGVHPNDNTATLWLQTNDLIRIIEKHGNQVHVTRI